MALQNLSLNSTPDRDNNSTRGQSVSTANRRHRKNLSNASNMSTQSEQYYHDANNNPLYCEPRSVPEMDFGRNGSTVRLFSRVPDRSPQDTPYGTIQLHEEYHEEGYYPLQKYRERNQDQDENRPPMALPTSEEGVRGRQIYHTVIQPAAMETQVRASQSGTRAERDAVARVDGALSHLNAINPEASFHLLRSILSRLDQQPQLRAMVAPGALVKVETLSPPASTNPSLSGSTLMNSTVQPREIGGQKRSPSHDSMYKPRRGTPESEEFYMEGLTGERPSSPLADVLYGRWLAGLRGRWESIGGVGAK